MSENFNKIEYIFLKNKCFRFVNYKNKKYKTKVFLIYKPYKHI